MRIHTQYFFYLAMVDYISSHLGHIKNHSSRVSIEYQFQAPICPQFFCIYIMAYIFTFFSEVYTDLNNPKNLKKVVTDYVDKLPHSTSIKFTQTNTLRSRKHTTHNLLDIGTNNTTINSQNKSYSYIHYIISQSA